MKHNTKKITAKVWEPILKKLDLKLDAACLKRDAYLSKVLSIELAHLDSEVVFSNSPAAHKFIADRLERLRPRKPVSFSLDESVIERLNDICARKAIVRDAFLNRMLLILAVAPATVDHLFFGSEKDEWRRVVWKELKHDGPFYENTLYPLEHDIDPFWGIRTGIEIYSEDDELVDFEMPESKATVRVRKNFKGDFFPRSGIYTDLFNDNQVKNTDLYGLNCFIADWQIPGHPTKEEFEKSLDELILADLGDV